MGGKGLGSAMLMVAALIWGTALVAQRLGMEHCGPLAFNAARFGLGGIVTGLALLLRAARAQRPKAAERAERNANRALLLRGGLWCGAVLFLTASLQQYGICFTSVGKAGFITSLYLVLVPLLGLFLGKKPSRTTVFSVALAVVGLYLLSCMGVSQINKGDLYLMGCALAFSVQITCIDRLAGNLDGLRMNCIQALVVTVLSVPFILLTKETVVFSDITACWFPLVFSGVLSMGVAYTLQIVGQQGLEPTTASLIMSLESVFAALGGWLILHQTMTPWELLGCGLVFAGVVLSQLPVGMFAKKS